MQTPKINNTKKTCKGIYIYDIKNPTNVKHVIEFLQRTYTIVSKEENSTPNHWTIVVHSDVVEECESGSLKNCLTSGGHVMCWDCYRDKETTIRYKDNRPNLRIKDEDLGELTLVQMTDYRENCRTERNAQ